MKYVLPVASGDRLGGIKVGEDFEIETDGTLNIKDMDAMRQQVQGLAVSVATGKEMIAGAITERGVETESDATFSLMAENIGMISSGGGNCVCGVPEYVTNYLPYHFGFGFASGYELGEL